VTKFLHPMVGAGVVVTRDVAPRRRWPVIPPGRSAGSASAAAVSTPAQPGPAPSAQPPTAWQTRDPAPKVLNPEVDIGRAGGAGQGSPPRWGGVPSRACS